MTISTLVTGGGGFIGLHLGRYLATRGENVILASRGSRPLPDFWAPELYERIRAERLDVGDQRAVSSFFDTNEVTHVVHLVAPAMAAVPIEEDYQTNVAGLFNILESARSSGVKRVCLASSVAVYMGLGNGPYREDMPLPVSSITPTEVFKKVWEIFALHYAARTGCDLVLARIGAIWGPLFWQYDSVPFPIVNLCRSAAGRSPLPPPLFADDGGDYCYVEDCVRGLDMLSKADSLQHQLYNLGQGRLVTHAEMAAAIKAVKPDVQIEVQPGSSGWGGVDGYMDISRISEDIGYRPQYDLRDAVAQYIGWLEENPV